jgi:hypothetical protein
MQTEAVFENIEGRIYQEITKAKRAIYVAVAWFANKNLFQALVSKAQEGCSVSLIISNDSINQNSSINFEQLQIKSSKVYKVGNGDTELMHNKFCIIDYSTVITGSYNWSYKAESNFENVIITKDDTSLAEQFISEFHNIRKQYYPENPDDDKIFPLEKIIKRLEIIKNYIILEDTEELSIAISKLHQFDFNSDISEIIHHIERDEFALAINKIQIFTSKNHQLTIWADPEIAALKLEIKNLEIQLNAYDNEKIELEKLLTEFQHRHTIELGEIIIEILKLRKLKYMDISSKFEEAENDERRYREQFDSEKNKKLFDLNDDQKKELKTKFRKASVLCHPDRVADKFKEAAQNIFIALKKAYDENDLSKVSEILESLEKGSIFNTQSETVQEKELLNAAISKFKIQIRILETEIKEIKDSNSFKSVISIENWDVYFVEIKSKLIKELEKLRLEV